MKVILNIYMDIFNNNLSSSDKIKRAMSSSDRIMIENNYEMKRFPNYCTVIEMLIPHYRKFN